MEGVREDVGNPEGAVEEGCTGEQGAEEEDIEGAQKAGDGATGQEPWGWMMKMLIMMMMMMRRRRRRRTPIMTPVEIAASAVVNLRRRVSGALLERSPT